MRELNEVDESIFTLPSDDLTEVPCVNPFFNCIVIVSVGDPAIFWFVLTILIVPEPFELRLFVIA